MLENQTDHIKTQKMTSNFSFVKLVETHNVNNVDSVSSLLNVPDVYQLAQVNIFLLIAFT